MVRTEGAFEEKGDNGVVHSFDQPQGSHSSLFFPEEKAKVKTTRIQNRK